jgi:hypothetical protein
VTNAALEEKIMRNCQSLLQPLRTIAFTISVGACLLLTHALAQKDPGTSQAVNYKAPAGLLPATQHVKIENYDAAVLPNGRLITPLGLEANVGAPKPFGMAVSRDGKVLATVNSGIGPFSVTLVKNLNTLSPQVTVIPVNAAFLGVAFSPDGSRFYAGGGENGNIWVGDTTSGMIVGTVNLNGLAHPTGGMNVVNGPTTPFKGTFPGRLVTSDGHFLYVTDQGGFQVLVVPVRSLPASTAKAISQNLTTLRPQSVLRRLAAILLAWSFRTMASAFMSPTWDCSNTRVCDRPVRAATTMLIFHSAIPALGIRKKR